MTPADYPHIRAGEDDLAVVAEPFEGGDAT
jgi:hypothetical protein